MQKGDTTKLKIIDAHLHFGKESYFDDIAQRAGHLNTPEHLCAEYERLGILHGIIMGNRSLEPKAHSYPPEFSYCIGLDNAVWQETEWRQNLALIEAHLKRKECVGIKLYPGYIHFYVSDDSLAPLYRLAEKYNKPVAVHTGLTAMSSACLKYSHPLTLDDAAAKFPGVQFVMCHLGEPWFTDAVAVLEKNPNVAADLSGMLEGKITDMDAFLHKHRRYVRDLTEWLEYLDAYGRIMFGTDWPLANLSDYISFTKRIIPESEWEKVFFQSACNIYHLSL